MTLVTVDVLLADDELRSALAHDVRAGLGSAPKSVPPTWFYDEEGSRLFDEITKLPEYYPTRAERGLLERHAAEIASVTGASTLIELGAGSSTKSRLLLDALCKAGTLRRYVPFDVSEEYLRGSAESIALEYPGVEVHALVADFLRHLGHVREAPRPDGGHAWLVAFLGGTIGNLAPARRTEFLATLRAVIEPGDHILVGTDLEKDTARLLAAYDDHAGVTARFNRNVLKVINRELDADFEPEAYAHVALWNHREHWMEMRLRAGSPQDVLVRALGMAVHFDQGEDLLTEVSTKFTPDGFCEELASGGFSVVRQWGARAGDFLLTLACPDSPT